LLKHLLVYFVKHPNFDLMQSISCKVSHASLGLCLMSSLLKGERMCTKLIELFANRVVERKNMINSTYGGDLALRVLGGFLSLSVSLLCLWFAAFLAIYWFCGFSFF
jgi:hypothetical protein